MTLALLIALLVAQSGFVPVTAEERYVAELRARIAQGDIEAEVALGNLYESGQSVLPLDPAQAAEWYRRAADKGHAGAQMNLAMMYFDGQGVARNVGQAVAWYEKAAGGGDAIAMLNLGSIYETGAERMPRDLAKAAAWYGKAAERGLGTAQYRLGMLYRDGRGVARDRSQAIDWLRQAAERDETDAQLELGTLLSPGSGPATDIVELERTMTDEQRAQAYRRATDWQDAHAWQRQSAASKPGTRNPGGAAR
jgi:TPR repeat protein